jgi:hypothetical protein
MDDFVFNGGKAMTAPYIYPTYCVPCLEQRKCQSLPHSVNCEALRRVDEKPKEEPKKE